LCIARYTEPFALLVALLAYEGKGGPELAYGGAPTEAAGVDTLPIHRRYIERLIILLSER
jgi:hypothetical protein